MSVFSFRKDFKKVQWGLTLWLNLLRAFAAGLVITIIVLLSGGNTGPNGPPLLAIPFIVPIGYLIALPAYILLTKFVAAILGGGFVFELALFCIVAMPILVLAAGDPLVFTLYKLKPALVPTERFNFMNFTLCLWVLDPQKLAEDT